MIDQKNCSLKTTVTVEGLHSIFSVEENFTGDLPPRLLFALHSLLNSLSRVVLQSHGKEYVSN